MRLGGIKIELLTLDTRLRHKIAGLILVGYDSLLCIPADRIVNISL